MHILNKKKSCVVIGAGIAGLCVSTCLNSGGFQVTILEKNGQAGGRARSFSQDGFTFDMGPSWYWMPDIIEKYFNRFGKSTRDYFELIRLNPSYQVVFGKNYSITIPSDIEELKSVFENIEKGASNKLDLFLREACYKYETSINDFVYKPGLSPMEYAGWKFFSAFLKSDMLRSLSSHARKFFKDSRLLKIVEFPSLFLGGKPSQIPALYSMMNYADMKLGTWYPMGGMFKLVDAMMQLAIESGVEIKYGEKVEHIEIRNNKICRVISDKAETNIDIVVAAADYHHVEQDLLDSQDRYYSTKYWNNRVLAPSSIIFYLGINKKIRKMLHHNLFFDGDFDSHLESIYDKPSYPDKPLFYVCCPSVTDNSVAPSGHENLFILIPVASGLMESEKIKEKYFLNVLERLENFCGENISNHIVLKRSYGGADFIADYNSFKGNAYGLANTLRQTAFMKPSIRSKKVHNLFFTGQLTVPGPGIPPSIISGQVVADYISRKTIN